MIRADETKSTHRVEVVPIRLEDHPGADSLSVARVFGYTCVCRTEDWRGVTKAAYIPPDSLVDVRRPEFAFLARDAKADGLARVKARKLRGIVSFGLLVPLPDDAVVGQDLAEQLGVAHYEPPVAGEAEGQGRSWMGGMEDSAGPAAFAPKYDLDAFRRYHHLFEDGEPVVVTEKLDGANARYVFDGGEMHCGSRSGWKREFSDVSHITAEFLREKGTPEEKIPEVLDRLANRPVRQNMWWEVMRRTRGLEEFCRAHPGVVVYGEVFGNVNCLKYGLPANQFAAFDLMVHGRWIDADQARQLLHLYGVPQVPLLNAETDDYPPQLVPIPYDFDRICGLAEGGTLVAGAKAGVIREGVVVKPVHERYDDRLGRVCLKCVSGAYLEKYR